MYQMFAVRDSSHDVIYMTLMELQASDTLRDLICSVSTMQTMVNDNGKTITGNAWLEILHTFCINDHCSEVFSSKPDFSRDVWWGS